MPVLEIGCGQGDFLRLLCEATGSTGIGIDPSLRDEHVAAAGPELELRRAFFTPEQIDAEVGLVACRHTLEHVHDVNGFLRMLHAGLADRPATPVFFEVPDTARILREMRVLGRLLRALLVLHAGLARRAVPPRRVHPDDARAGLRRPVHPARRRDRGPRIAGGRASMPPPSRRRRSWPPQSGSRRPSAAPGMNGEIGSARCGAKGGERSSGAGLERRRLPGGARPR